MPKGLVAAHVRKPHVARGKRVRGAKYTPIQAPPETAAHLKPAPKVAGIRGTAVRTRIPHGSTAAPQYGTLKVPKPTSAPAHDALDQMVQTAAQMRDTSQVMPGVMGPLGLPGEPAKAVIPGLSNLLAQQQAVSPGVQLTPPVP